MSEAATAAGAPQPQTLYVELHPDDPARVYVAVACPLCWRVHTYVARRGEPWIVRAAMCDEGVVYEIDAAP